MMRKVIQMLSVSEHNLIVLCDDGTMWDGVWDHHGKACKWASVTPVPQGEDEDEAASEESASGKIDCKYSSYSLNAPSYKGPTAMVKWACKHPIRGHLQSEVNQIECADFEQKGTSG